MAGMTNFLSRAIYKRSSRVGSWFDRMTYRPYKGARMGWTYRLWK